MLVPGLAVAGIEAETPDADVLVLEHDLIADTGRAVLRGLNPVQPELAAYAAATKNAKATVH